MTMQTATVSLRPLAAAPAGVQARGAVDTHDDAFNTALKAADQHRRHARQAVARENTSAQDASGKAQDPSGIDPRDPQWLANFSAMIGHLQPPQPPAPAAVDASAATADDNGAHRAASIGISADPADTSYDEAALAGLADSAPSPRSRRAAGIATAPDARSSMSPKNAAIDPAAASTHRQGTAEAEPLYANPAAPAVAQAARSAAPLAEVGDTTVSAGPSVLPDIAAPTTPHGNAQGAHATFARTEAPTIPGAATSLHGQALQGRLDEALRWMAGNGVQTAQIQVTPDELGPITVRVHMQGDTTHVAFSSAHETTRQLLEASLGDLRDTLAADGLSLGQASVGSERQAGHRSADNGPGEPPRGSSDVARADPDDATSPPPGATPQRPAGVAAATRQVAGLVNLYA